ncbi:MULTISPECIES: hypothetical protein [Streptomyces]|uniref:DUF3040 domain-containing protein n=1 Tax=Streptomyces koyangensis TaxID=188770 RepID=A0A385DIM9_9ACTN|nr:MULTISPECIES: hypothetical protein [Streptomyces]AXQ57527.1 hypothetical protein D0C37_24965 [Streptomyces koyangensis]PKR44772.1 hypothetical protein CWE27_13380 [Streptomyces sp. EAG2]
MDETGEGYFDDRRRQDSALPPPVPPPATPSSIRNLVSGPVHGPVVQAGSVHGDIVFGESEAAHRQRAGQRWNAQARGTGSTRAILRWGQRLVGVTVLCWAVSFFVSTETAIVVWAVGSGILAVAATLFVIVGVRLIAQWERYKRAENMENEGSDK